MSNPVILYNNTNSTCYILSITGATGDETLEVLPTTTTPVSPLKLYNNVTNAYYSLSVVGNTGNEAIQISTTTGSSVVNSLLYNSTNSTYYVLNVIGPAGNEALEFLPLTITPAIIPPNVVPTNIDQPPCCKRITLNHYTVPRIVYEIIKTYMLNNTPEEAGVRLAQTYNADPTKSQILLDMSYNWKTKDMSKVPAIFIQRGDASYKPVTMGQHEGYDKTMSKDNRFSMCSLPVIVTCVAAEPLPVVENLAEYVKQPLLYFRNEVQRDFGIRRFKLDTISKPNLISEGKNIFSVDLSLTITFDDQWVVERNDPKIRHINVQLFDDLWNKLETLDV